MNNKKINEYIHHYLKNFESAKVDLWNYEDGCVLIGAIQIYRATHETFYKDFVLQYLQKYITEDGKIRFYEKSEFNIDGISTGRTLFFALQETGEKKYRQAIEVLMDQIKDHPRTKSMNFWHKLIYPNQIWLDGLFMAQPFYMMAETKLGQKANYSDIIDQFKNVRKFLFNEEKGLYYHGYDESRQMLWADKVSGCSPNFWLRSMGWYVLALIDTIEEMSQMLYEHKMALVSLFKEAIKGLLKYQDGESKLFYQVIDKPEAAGNYLETSGSSMVAAAILKACRLKVLLGEKYASVGTEILNALAETKLIRVDGVWKLSDMCSVAGLGPKETRDGSVAYYLSEPIVCDDHKGTGAFMMAYGQYLQWMQSIGEEA